MFRLIVSEEQRGDINSFLRSPEDLGWLRATTVTFGSLAELVFHVAGYVQDLHEAGWRTHCLSDFVGPQPWDNTVDLRRLERLWTKKTRPPPAAQPWESRPPPPAAPPAPPAAPLDTVLEMA